VPEHADENMLLNPPAAASRPGAAPDAISVLAVASEASSIAGGGTCQPNTFARSCASTGRAITSVAPSAWARACCRSEVVSAKNTTRASRGFALIQFLILTTSESSLRSTSKSVRGPGLMLSSISNRVNVTSNVPPSRPPNSSARACASPMTERPSCCGFMIDQKST